MSDNKFIKRLKGEQTAKSVLEIKNESAKTSFANMPQGTSNAIDVFSDHRGNATAVLNGTTNWKVSNSDLLLADAVSGDGQDFTSTYSVSGSGLWVNASYTFPSTGDPRHPVAMVFNPSTKWVLKVCGDNLIVDGGSTVDFTMLVKIGTSNVYSKNFTIRESAGQFSKEFIIDFGEANSDVVKAGGLSTLTVQLLCGTANASARIYNGMTVLTCLQRKVDASAVSNSSANVEDVLDGNIIPSDYFSNPEFIDQVEDGEQAYAVFERDGDNVNLAGWTPKDDIATTTQLNDEITARENADLGLQNQINTNKGTMDGHIANTSNPHQVTKTQVGLGNVDNTSDLDKPISAATQTALDEKMPISTKYGAALSLTINSTTYVVTAQLKDQDGNNLGTAQTIDLPLESVVVSGAYDSVTKEVVLTLQGGSTIRFSVADLVSGLQTEITALNMLSADLVDDTDTTHKFVTTTEKTNWNNHIASTNNPHQVTKAQVGLGNVNNTSDLNKPISTATQTALDLKADKSTIGNATLTIQKNSTTIDTFTANATSNKTIDIAVPTKTSDITNDSGFITSSALAPYALSADLATVATTGDYDDLSNKPAIPTVGNGTITITQGGISKGTFTTNQSGNTTIALDAGGGGIGNIDNLTITANADDEIQAVATVNQNTATGATNPIYDWVGTLEEYNNGVQMYAWSAGVIRTVFTDTETPVVGGKAYRTPDTTPYTIDAVGNNTITVGSLISERDNTKDTYFPVYTLHPDWVCFITDDLTSAAYDAYSKSQTDTLLAGKVSTGHEVIAFQAPTAQNNYTWYRKYADGWVEQGGVAPANTTVTLPIQMQNIDYTVTACALGTSVLSVGINRINTTSIYINTNAQAASWQVSGMAA
jgi:hypothetical protein